MKRPEERQYRYMAAPAEDEHGRLGDDWHNEVSMAGWSEEMARRFAQSFRYQGFVIRETREWAYGDSGYHDTPMEARAAYYAKHPPEIPQRVALVCANEKCERHGDPETVATRDATAYWDNDAQEWRMNDINAMDHPYCPSCGGGVEEQPIKGENA